MSTPEDAVILDLDGTLVDSVYVHVRAWAEAFTEAGIDHVPDWRIHAAIGLPSERLVRRLLGRVPDPHLADRLSAGHKRRFLDAADGLRPTAGATELLADLADRGVPTVVATSAGSEEREALLAVLDDPDLVVTDADDLEGGKPDSEVLRSAAERLEGDPASIRMVGDAPWDGYAAITAGMLFCAVRTGGFGDAVLREAGAGMLVDAPADYLGVL